MSDKYKFLNNHSISLSVFSCFTVGIFLYLHFSIGYRLRWILIFGLPVAVSVYWLAVRYGRIGLGMGRRLLANLRDRLMAARSAFDESEEDTFPIYAWLVPFCSFAFISGFIVWSMDRGFAFFDEGYADVFARWPADALGVTWFGFLTHAITGGGDVSPTVFRTISFLMFLFSASILASGGVHFLSRRSAVPLPLTSRAFVYALTLMGGLLAYTIKTNTLSYNEWAAFFSFIASGVTLKLLAGKESDRSWRVRSFAVGLCIFGLSVTKVPAGISVAAFLLTVVLAVSIAERRPTDAFKAFLFGAFGASAGAILMFSASSELREITFLMPKILNALSKFGYDQSVVVMGITALFGKLVVVFPVALATSLLVLGVGVRMRSFPPITLLAVFGTIAIGFLVAAFGSQSWPLKFAFGSSLDYANCWYCYVPGIFPLFAASVAAFAAMLAYFIRGGKHHDFLPSGMALLVLVLCPLLTVIGTKGDFITIGASAAAPWFSAIAIAFLLMPALRGRKAQLATFILLTAIVVPVQVFESFVLQPRRLNGSMFQQSEPLAIGGPMRGVKVDRETKTALESLFDAVTKIDGYSAGIPILMFYEYPGMLFALQGRPLGAPWLSDRDNGRIESGCELMKLRSNFTKLPIVLRSAEIAPRHVACMQEIGIPFPDKYRVTARITFPAYQDYAAATIEVLSPNE